ncbi:MAG: RES family NAD+ phosphorylase [Candidatus Obscuribacterales bacterium]|nr:RES family NAD+ phosphorylase [Candidatus Obscuribacterales bacterium]
MTATAALTNVRWIPSWRIIADSYPPINFFERISDPADWEVLLDLAKLTDPSIEDVGDIGLIPVEERISGPGSGRVMPSFTFLDPNPPGSRFSNSAFGAYYAGNEMETAIAETVHHSEQFLQNSGITEPMDIDRLVILTDISGQFHDIRGMQTTLPDIYHSSDYTASQGLATALRASGSFGIVYSSVRKAGGECVAVFRPTVITNFREDMTITYRWDGTRITGRFRKMDWTSI